MNRLTASLQRFAATTRARTLEFLRDRSALSWNLLFPIVLVGGFAMIFSGEPEPLFRVAVMGAPTSATAAFLETPGVATEPVQAQDTAIQRVARQRIDMLLDVETQPVRYWINPNAQSGALLEHLLRATLTAEPPQRVAVAGDPIRYVDWVLPGILAMNVMFSSLWGVGYGIVRYRKNGYLKRLNATPLTALEFICAQLASRLGLVVLMTSIMFAGCQWLIGFRMAGSALDLLVVAVLGSVAMIALGLIIAARVTSEELASGMLNIFSWPMLVLSGVFYSIDEAPQWLQGLAQWLPLTHILDAARAIMLDGAGLWEVRGALLALAAMSIALLVLGASLFKWTPQG
ncbi:ABC transporter permease [Algiphilus sp.]|uniref:ABC transporter permease n=1 Tax=Algiphilus sp. TaxID=1872431 RepID=UPI0032F043F7